MSLAATLLGGAWQRHAEAEIRASEARLRILVGCANGIAFEFDAEGRYLNVWTNDESLLARPRSELFGKTTGEVLGPDWGEPFVARIRSVIASGKSDSFEYSLDLPDGQRWFVGDLVKEPPELDGPPRVAMLIRDITDLKATHVALEQSEARFRTFVEHAPDPISVTREQHILYANPAMARFLGYDDPAEFFGLPIANFLDPEERTRVAELNASLNAGRAIGVTQHRYICRDGSYADAEVARHLIDYDGQPATLAVFRDLRERHELQRRALFMDRMASIGTLAAGVAHEINNPLSYVIANIDVAVEKLRETGAGDSEVLELLGQAAEGAGRVQKVVRDLKTFTRSEEETRAPVDVERVLDSAAAIADNEIRHRARLVKRYGTPPPVLANEARLGQVFVNLLVNAAQAISDGHATDNEIRLCTSADGSSTLIEISDSGSGIAPEILPRIFHGFFTTKPIGAGTGMGLTIARDIVSSFGGSIEVESVVGRGSTFRVRLPSTLAETQLPVPSSKKAEPLPRGKLLIVDDDAGVGWAAKRLLRVEQDAVIAESAVTALALIREGAEFDAILCDLMMPEMSGMEFYAELEKIAPKLTARIAFMTGGTFTQAARNFVDRVSQPVLEKPFSPGELKSTVRRLVARSRAG